MNIRFEPIQLLDVNDLRYCEFCSQAALSNKVHNDPSCILDDLSLVSCSNSQTKSLNFGFYQCFLKNCTSQVRESQDFSTHLTSHGIWLEQAKCKYKYKCQKCSYKTTQQRYLDNHKEICTGNGESSDCEDESDKVGDGSDRADNENVADNGSCSSSDSRLLDVVEKGNAEVCERSKQKASVAEQILKEHSVLHRYRCTECNYSTTQQRYLTSHQQNYCIGSAKAKQSAAREKGENKVSAARVPASLTSEMKKPINQEKMDPPRKLTEFKIRLGKSGSAPESPNTCDNEEDGKENTSHIANKNNNVSQRFKCPNCSYSTTQRRYLEGHNKTCAGSSSTSSKNERESIPCNTCSYVAQDSWAMEVHMQSHHISQSSATPNGPADMNPEHNIPSNTNSNKAISTLSSSGDVGKVELHKCTDCSFKTRNVRLFNLHVKSCIRNKRKRDSIAKQKKAHILLKRVMLTKVKTEIESFNCDLCSFVGKNRVSVRMHKIASHYKRIKSKSEKNNLGQLTKAGGLQASCPNCPYKPIDHRSRSSDMEAHLKVCGKDLTRTIYKCFSCFYLTCSKPNFDRHKKKCINRHTTVESSESMKSPSFAAPKLQCSFCPYKAKLSIMVKHHERKCNSVLYKKFRCKACSDVLATREKFDRHILNCNLVLASKESEEPPKYGEISCKKCSYHASTKLQLARHASMCGMPGLKSFRCEKCNHLSRRKPDYDSHTTRCKRKKTKMSELSCPKCFYLATNRSSLAVHATLCGNNKFELKRCQKCHFIAKTAYGHLKHKTTCKSTGKPGLKYIGYNANKGKLMKCSKCTEMIKWSVYSRHRLRCCNPLFDAFKCPHKNCHYIGRNDFCLKVHSGKVHDKKNSAITKVSQHSIANVSQHSIAKVGQHTIAEYSQNAITDIFSLLNVSQHSCVLCPFVSSLKTKTEKHMILCRLRRNGCKTILVCNYSDCFFLASCKKGMAVHHRFIHSESLQTASFPKVSAKTSNTRETNSLKKEGSMAKATKQLQLKKRYYCDRCPYFAYSSNPVMSHKALCALKQNGVSGIIACGYPNCYFLTELIGSYKKHHKLKHRLPVTQGAFEMDYRDVFRGNAGSSLTRSSEEHVVSSIGNTRKEQGDKLQFNCDTCPFSCKISSTLRLHKLLCTRKLKGDKSIITCEYPGCHSLSVSVHGYKVHVSRSNHQGSSASVKEISKSVIISKSTRSEAEGIDVAEKQREKTQDTSMKCSEMVSCNTDLLSPLLREEEPVMEDYYTCEKCPYKCFRSDVPQIESHKENCRTQLFDKFKLPLVPSYIIEKNFVESNVEKDEGEDLSTVNVVILPPKTDIVDSELTLQSDVQVPDDTLESQSAIPPTDLLELPVSTNPQDGTSSQENDIFVSDSTEPVAANSLDGKSAQENDILVSDSSEPVAANSLDGKSSQENDIFVSDSSEPVAANSLDGKLSQENDIFVSDSSEPLTANSLDGKSSHENDIFVSDSLEPVPDIPLDDKSSQESDIFASEEFDELSLCLDSEYFI